MGPIVVASDLTTTSERATATAVAVGRACGVAVHVTDTGPGLRAGDRERATERFWRAADASRVRPVAQPAYDYDLPESDHNDWRFTATVSVQPLPEPPDWTKLEVPAVDPDVPPEAIDAELETLRASVDSFNETLVSVPIEVLRLARTQFDYLSSGFARRGDVIAQAMSEIGGFAIDQALANKKPAGKAE